MFGHPHGRRREEHPLLGLNPARSRSLVKVAAALVVCAVALNIGPQPHRPVPGDNLVANATFDDTLDGWTTRPGVELGRSTSAHDGSHAAVLSTTVADRDVILDDSPNTVSSTVEGVTYDVSGWVRAETPTLAGQVRVREVGRDGEVAVSGRSFSLTDDGWTRVAFSFATKQAGSSLDLSVLGWKPGRAQRLYVDSLSLTERRPAAPTPAPSPTPTPTPTPALSPTPTTTPSPSPSPTPSPTPTPARPTGPSIATLSNGVGISSRGVPARGALVGAAVGGNADPRSFEKQAGQRLGVRRTYWGPDETDQAVRTARLDLAAGRLPWISFKLPYSWARMAKGDGDAWTRSLALRLSALPGPVWVAFHHEPETHGNMQDWTRMQERLGPILRRDAPNAAFTVILTGYHELSGDPRYSLDTIWPETTVDVVGFDLYNYYGTRTAKGRLVTEPSDLRHSSFEPLGRWAAAKGVAWGLAETGLNDAAAERYPDLMLETYQAMVDNGGVVLTYFNSRYNSSSSWSITTRAKMNQFASVLKATPTFPEFV